MNMGVENAKEFKRLAESLDKVFQRAEELTAVFENSQKPRQRKIVEILHKHGLPAFVGPFFDAYFRITAGGGDMEQISLLMVARLSAYLGDDPSVVAQRHKAAIADYVEFMSRDLDESDDYRPNEQYVHVDG